MSAAALLDVVVPPGVGPGELVEFLDGDGNPLQAVVPDGLSEGDTFQVELQPDGSVHPVEELHAYMEERAEGEGSGIMDHFVAWFERESVGDQVDGFVKNHAHIMRGAEGIAGEQSHDWWPLYNEYTAQFDGLLQQFLDEEGCSAEEFLAAAEGASGMNDIYMKIFLTCSDYEVYS